MAKTKLQAKISYNPEKDEYALYIRSSEKDTWGFCTGCKCQHSNRDDDEAEPMFVHIALIEEIRKCIKLGYEFVN